MPRVLLFNKPYGVLSQFTAEPGQRTLADYIQQPGFYAAGRLDKDSEGLLVLTDDGRLQQRIANPRHGKPKSYLVQVDGEIDAAALQRLCEGVRLKDGLARAVQAIKIPDPDLWPRQPPVRYRKHIPTSWIRLTLDEGRNRQVRRMTAAAGFPTLRLVRTQVGPWDLGNLKPGQWLMKKTSSAV